MTTKTMTPPTDLIPKIGDKGYYAIGTDVYPITAVEVSKAGKWVRVRFENFVGDKENGHDYFGIQKWIISENPKGKLKQRIGPQKDSAI